MQIDQGLSGLTLGSKGKPDPTGVVTVRVGNEQNGGPQEFHVKRSVLCATSGFFKGSQNPAWSQPEGLNLVDDDPEIFKRYMEFLHTDRCFVGDAWEAGRWGEGFHTLVRLYVFGLRILDEEFQDEIMCKLCNSVDRCHPRPPFPDRETIALIYAETHTSAKIRPFIIDVVTWSLDGERDELVTLGPDLGDEFMADLIKGLLRYRDYYEADSNRIASGLPRRQPVDLPHLGIYPWHGLYMYTQYRRYRSPEYRENRL